MRIWLSRCLAVLLIVPAMGMVALDHASAGCKATRSSVRDAQTGGATYGKKVVCTTEVAGSKGTPGGKSKATCDLTNPWATFCSGTYPCSYMEPDLVYKDPPSTPAPTPGAKWHVQLCVTSADGVVRMRAYGIEGMDAKSVWVGQSRKDPSQAERATMASGQIDLPSGTLSFSPPRRTYVNLDTWFWAKDLATGDVRGTPASGMVAIATPYQLEITPGDGSATLPPCKLSTRNSDLCHYTYQRSSVNGTERTANGDPAYKATGNVIWKLRFEDGGVPIPNPAGAPASVPGPEMTAKVAVGEIQTIVTG